MKRLGHSEGGGKGIYERFRCIDSTKVPSSMGGTQPSFQGTQICSFSFSKLRRENVPTIFGWLDHSEIDPIFFLLSRIGSNFCGVQWLGRTTKPPNKRLLSNMNLLSRLTKGDNFFSHKFPYLHFLRLV